MDESVMFKKNQYKYNRKDHTELNSLPQGKECLLCMKAVHSKKSQKKKSI